MSEYNLYLDTVNGVLVAPANTAASLRLRPFTQDDNPTINIYPVRPTNDLTDPYDVDDLSTSNLAVALCGGTGKPTGTRGSGASAPVEIARQDTLTWATDHFTGTLDCGTTQFDAFLGSQDQKATVFEIRVLGPAGQSTRYQFSAVAKAAVMEGALPGSLDRSRIIPPVAVTIAAGQAQSAPIVVPYIHATDLPLYTDPRVMTATITVNEDDETLSTLTVEMVAGVAPAGGLNCFALIFFNP